MYIQLHLLDSQIQLSTKLVFRKHASLDGLWFWLSMMIVMRGSSLCTLM